MKAATNSKATLSVYIAGIILAFNPQSSVTGFGLLSSSQQIRIEVSFKSSVWANHGFLVCPPNHDARQEKLAIHKASRYLTSLCARSRGLEVGTGGATPTEGGMTLYLKSGPDGSSPGDCPFAQYVRMVLEEKGLEYQLRPCASNDDKPAWLLDHYEGKMPALRHKADCYVESDVIAQYLDFFFQPDSLTSKKKFMAEANEIIDGFFPAFAKYAKHTPDGDDDDKGLKEGLEKKLAEFQAHLSKEDRTGPWFVGDGQQFTLLDCSLAPKLYHLKTCLEAFKGNTIDLVSDYPKLSEYMDAAFARPSFKKSACPTEYVTWGWDNARNKM